MDHRASTRKNTLLGATYAVSSKCKDCRKSGGTAHKRLAAFVFCSVSAFGGTDEQRWAERIARAEREWASGQFHAVEAAYREALVYTRGFAETDMRRARNWHEVALAC